MMKTKKSEQGEVPFRKRGRPSGRNRVPLSLEERRARNAHYERERRNETAEAMAQLAEAAGCDSNISNADLLATVIAQIQRSNQENAENNVEDLLRINAKLESEIAMLQEQLGFEEEQEEDPEDTEEFLPIEPQPSVIHTSASSEEPPKKKNKKRKRTQCSSDQNEQKEKRMKTQSETSTDSGLGSLRQSVSPIELIPENNVQYTPPIIEQQHRVQVNEVPNQTVPQTYVDLQSGLYGEIYHSECQPTVQPVHEWNATSFSEPYMDSETRMLMEFPSILLEEPLEPCFQPPMPLQSSIGLVQEQPSDLNILNTDDCEILPSVEMTLNLLTDNERGLISGLLNEFSEATAVND